MDMKEINTEINRLECADTNYTNCSKLATLYTVRNGLVPESAHESTQNVSTSGYSYASSPPKSEFIQAFMDAPLDDAVEILDKHMNIIKTLYPKEYSVIIRKLIEL